MRGIARPFVATAAALLLIIGLTAFFTVRLARERDYANRQAAIATATNRFLSDDLLGRADPFNTGRTKELFADVVQRASPLIDRQFRTEPIIAAQLHRTIARAFDNRSEFAEASAEYDLAHKLFLQGQGPLSEDAIQVRLQQVCLVARSNERGSLASAKSLLNDAEAAISKIGGLAPIWPYGCHTLVDWSLWPGMMPARRIWSSRTRCGRQSRSLLSMSARGGG